MRYILAKDLPFAKAGSEIVFESDVVNNTSGDMIRVKVNDNIKQYAYRFIGYVQEKERLISEGWTKEVIPREWWISESVLRDMGRETKEELYNGWRRKDLIKIREIE